MVIPCWNPRIWCCKRVCRARNIQSIHIYPVATSANQNRNLGSVPDITETLNLRKTPHLPPKSPGARHTNIGGSPIRHSPVRADSPDRQSSPPRPLSAQPSSRANRLLDFSVQEPPRPSLNQSPSPFKPRPGKSAKSQKTRKSLFAFTDTPEKHVQDTSEEQELDKTVQEIVDHLTEDATEAFTNGGDYIPMIEDATMDDQVPDVTEAATEAAIEGATEFVTEALTEDVTEDATEEVTGDVTEAAAEATTTSPELNPQSSRKTPRTRKTNGTSHSILEIDANGSPAMTASSSNQKRKRGRPRTSEPSTLAGAEATESLEEDEAPPSQKRRRSSFNETSIIDTTETSLPDETMNDTTIAPQGPSTRKKRAFQVQRDQEEVAADDDEEVEEVQSNASFEDFQPPPEEDVQELETEPVQEQPKKRGRPKASAKQKAQKNSSQRKPTERETSVNIRLPRESESVDPEGKKRGPRSIVQLRAGTPMEDDGAKQTRSGRTSIKPLKYWQNETYVWDHGEINAVVRASEVEQPKKQVNRSAGKRKGRPPGARLAAIQEDEEDEDEELLPEAWEEEMGVINGEVRAWDADIGAGNPDETTSEGILFHSTSGMLQEKLTRPDLAFASTSIATRDVQNSAFRYAKIMTLPFFGSGMVEIPPSGFKRTKNSRKMQMVFFVHEGKVTVEVGDLKFGMTKGGVWQVPRGTFNHPFTLSFSFPFPPVFSNPSHFLPLRPRMHEERSGPPALHRRPVTRARTHSTFSRRTIGRVRLQVETDDPSHKDVMQRPVTTCLQLQQFA